MGWAKRASQKAGTDGVAMCKIVLRRDKRLVIDGDHRLVALAMRVLEKRAAEQAEKEPKLWLPGSGS